MSMPQSERRLMILSVFLVGLCLAAAAPDEPKGASATPLPDGMQPGLPKGWYGGPFGGGEYQHGIDTKTKKSGKAAAFIRAVQPGKGAVLTQVIAPGELASKRVRYSGQVKTAGADPGVGLWMRVDSPKGSPSFDNMSRRMIQGDQDWSRAEVVLDVPADATAIAFGAILFGKGTLWLDDLNFEVVDKSVPVTSPLALNPTGVGRDSSAGLPEKPVNLGFEDGLRGDDFVKPQALTAAEKAWLSRSLIPLDTVEPRKPLADLQPLKSIVGDARIVALGESTHGTREHFLMKHRLLEFLVTELGFTHFAIEANMTEAFAVNDYVLTGKGNGKEALAGLYFWTWYTEEVLDLIEWLREYNRSAKTKVQFLGFDMQTGSVALAQAKAFIAEADPPYLQEAAAAMAKAAVLFPKTLEDRQALQRMKKEDKQPLIDGLWSVVQHLEENRDRYERALPGEAVRGIQHARVAAQAARNTLATFNYRDQCMAENAAWILDHALPESKLVLWAHNGHVRRTPGAMGSHLSKRFGKGQLIIGFAAGEGYYTAIAPGQGLKKDNPLSPAPEGSLEAVCQATGQGRFLLDLRPSASVSDAKWLTRPHLFRSIGALAVSQQFHPTVVPHNYDVLVYIGQTTASRCFGFTQARAK